MIRRTAIALVLSVLIGYAVGYAVNLVGGGWSAQFLSSCAASFIAGTVLLLRAWSEVA